MAEESRGPWRVFPSLSPRDRLLVGASIVVACWLLVDPLLVRVVRDLPPGVVAFFRAITDIGKADWILALSGLVWLAFLGLRATATTARARAAHGYASQLAGFVFLTAAAAGIAANLAKNIVGRARPRHFETLGPLDFTPFAFQADLASFPSGHATTIFALAATLGMLWPRARVPLFVLAFWIAVSRLIVGSHYLADVLAGAALGIGVAHLVRDRLAARRWLFRPAPGGPILRGPRLAPWLARTGGARLGAALRKVPRRARHSGHSAT